MKPSSFCQWTSQHPVSRTTLIPQTNLRSRYHLCIIMLTAQVWAHKLQDKWLRSPSRLLWMAFLETMVSISRFNSYQRLWIHPFRFWFVTIFRTPCFVVEGTSLQVQWEVSRHSYLPVCIPYQPPANSFFRLRSSPRYPSTTRRSRRQPRFDQVISLETQTMVLEGTSLFRWIISYFPIQSTETHDFGQSVTVNGKPYKSNCYLDWDVFTTGATVELTLTTDINVSCGTGNDALPPSLSTGGFN